MPHVPPSPMEKKKKKINQVKHYVGIEPHTFSVWKTICFQHNVLNEKEVSESNIKWPGFFRLGYNFSFVCFHRKNKWTYIRSGLGSTFCLSLFLSICQIVMSYLKNNQHLSWSLDFVSRIASWICLVIDCTVHFVWWLQHQMIIESNITGSFTDSIAELRKSEILFMCVQVYLQPVHLIDELLCGVIHKKESNYDCLWWDTLKNFLQMHTFSINSKSNQSCYLPQSSPVDNLSFLEKKKDLGALGPSQHCTFELHLNEGMNISITIGHLSSYRRVAAVAVYIPFPK